MSGGVRSGSRYLGGAVLCAAINNAILIVGAHLGIADTAGVIATWLAGGSVGYLYHTRVTYGQAPSRRGYVQFMTGVAIGTPLTWVLIMLMRRGLGWPMEWAAPATTAILVVYNYLNARLAIHWRRQATG